MSDPEIKEALALTRDDLLRKLEEGRPADLERVPPATTTGLRIESFHFRFEGVRLAPSSPLTVPGTEVVFS